MGVILIFHLRDSLMKTHIFTLNSFRRLKEVGITSRVRRIFHSEKLKCVRDVHLEDFTVDIAAIYPLLILLFCGIVLSFVVLVAEIWIFQRNRRH
jgi:hypothetical protein